MFFFSVETKCVISGLEFLVSISFLDYNNLFSFVFFLLQGFVLSLLVSLCQNWGLGTHAIQQVSWVFLLPLEISSRTQEKNLLLGRTDEDFISEDVVEGGLPPLGYCRMCDLFSISFKFLIALCWVCKFKSSGSTIYVDSFLWYIGYLICKCRLKKRWAGITFCWYQ